MKVALLAFCLLISNSKMIGMPFDCDYFPGPPVLSFADSRVPDWILHAMPFFRRILASRIPLWSHVTQIHEWHYFCCLPAPGCFAACEKAVYILVLP